MSTYRHNHRRPRGAALFIFIVVIVGGALTGALLSDKILNLLLTQKPPPQTTQQAKESLINYMLLRGEQPLDIKSNRVIKPRLLMLPCPDNLSDSVLDGSQDPTCGAVTSASNKVNGILDSGSRFGRLPWRAGFSTDVVISDNIKDGLGRDFQDIHDNRLWYAVSRKMVPATNPAPLNFHHLAANDDDWLQMIVTNSIVTMTISKKVAAVILSPGKHKRGRLPEDTIINLSMKYNDPRIATDLYFEEIAGESNADKDGVFIQAATDKDFDDPLAYLTFDELLRADGDFMPRFQRMVGMGKWHNAPLDKRPLARLQEAIMNWQDFFGFYPSPAANTTMNVATHFRHCETADSGDTAITITITPLPMIPPADLHITASLTTGGTATLAINRGAFLMPKLYTVGVTTFTLAAWSRVSATMANIIVPTVILNTVDGGYQLNAGVTVIVDGQIIIPPQTPISPGGFISGWFGEYDKTVTIISKDHSVLTIKDLTKTGFLGRVLLTSSAPSTITLRAKDSLILARGGSIKLEDEYENLTTEFDDAVIHYADGTMNPISGYKPIESFYNQRQFVVLLHSDIARASHTIFAPAVLYPWKTTPSPAAITRDNLHPWPPCFDARDLPRNLQTFIEDNPIHYAVADNCHYGGEWSRCGQNGITLSIAHGVAIALPNAFTLTHSFTAHFDGVEILISNGVAMTDFVLTRPAELLIRNDTQTLAAMDLPSGFAFTVSQTVIIAAGTKMTGGDSTHIVNIPALLIYSPAPLSRVACLGNAESGIMDKTVTVDGITVATQLGENLTHWCQWLDYDENANLDSRYELPSPQPLWSANDYFILLGGHAMVE